MSLSSYGLVYGSGQVLMGLALVTFFLAYGATLYQGFRRSVLLGLAVLLLAPFSVGVYLFTFRKEHPRILRTLLISLGLFLLALLPLLLAKSMRDQGGASNELVDLVRDMAPLRDGLAAHVAATGRWPDEGELARVSGAGGLDGLQRRFFSEGNLAWVKLATENYVGAPSIEFAGRIDPASRSISWSCTRDQPERGPEVCTAWEAGIRIQR